MAHPHLQYLCRPPNPTWATASVRCGLKGKHSLWIEHHYSQRAAYPKLTGKCGVRRVNYDEAAEEEVDHTQLDVGPVQPPSHLEGLSPHTFHQQPKFGQSFVTNSLSRSMDVKGARSGLSQQLTRQFSLAYSEVDTKDHDIKEIGILSTISSIREARHSAFLCGHRIAFVPTMGALHDGHLNLVRAAAKECDEVFVSVYVNPAQFGANEDLSSYPQTFEKDLAELQRLNTEFQNSAKDQFRGRVTQIFRPSTEAMYPVGLELGSYIAMNPTISQVLEGKSRPQFFQGVSTVVTKLLNIVQPDLVYLGQKDIQQLIVVQRMINEFHLPPQLRCIATRRHLDGLAMSSRNMYLGARRRAVATCLYKSLIAGYQRYLGHQMSREQILGETVNLAEGIRQNQMAKPSSQRVRFEIDYLSLADPTYLKEVDQVDENVGAILSGAMVMLPLEEPQPGEELGLGDDKRPVRLIDNFLLGAARDIGSNQA